MKSTAQTLRDAAVTWPMPRLDFTERCAMYDFHPFLGDDSNQYRTFMLLIACALDGGPREPMPISEMENLVQTSSPLPRMSDVVRAVERYHGIGVQG
jgi:hypothetical protein